MQIMQKNVLEGPAILKLLVLGLLGLLMKLNSPLRDISKNVSFFSKPVEITPKIIWHSTSLKIDPTQQNSPAES